MNWRFFTIAIASRVNWPPATRSTLLVRLSRYFESGPKPPASGSKVSASKPSCPSRLAISS